VSFIDPAAWKEIYLNKEFLRPKQWGSRPPGVTAHSVISAPVEVHARFRKAMGAAFSEKATKAQEPIIGRYVDVLMTKLKEKIECSDSGKHAVVNMVEWFNYTTFDIFSDLGWGQSFDCLEKQEYHPWVTVILQFQELLIGVSLAFYPTLNTLISYITPKSALAGLNLVLRTSTENVRRRLESKTDRPDMMSSILAHNEANPSLSMSEEEMVANSMALVIAGSDTLTTALAGTINELLRSPKELKILVYEIRVAFKSEAEIDGQSTRGLEYLTAVLQEGLRVCPPLPDNLHREVPRGGALITGLSLPEGVSVGVPCYATFKSGSNFSRPEEFIPERWLQKQDKGSSFVNDRHDAFYPFSLGPHGCLGQQLAWVELRVILARLLWNFDIQIPEGTKPLEWTSQKIFWAWEKQPVNVSLSKDGRR
jgi:cytochrome P450